MSSFWEYLKGMMWGVVLGISGTNLYWLNKPISLPYPKVAEFVQTAASLSCNSGVVGVANYVIGNTKKFPDCKAIAKEWSDIYTDKKK